MTRRSAFVAFVIAALGGCAGKLSEQDPAALDAETTDANRVSNDASAPGDATREAEPATRDAASDPRDGGDDRDAERPYDAGPAPFDAGAPPEPCTTRITYGSRWIHGPEHPAQHDDVAGVVTWDGVCTRDGGNSYATLSNGWRPYFEGPSSCIIAFDLRGDCAPAPSAACATRVSYGASWLRAPAHPADFDDVAGVVTWDGVCRAAGGGTSSALLSNGWAPHFSGSDGCALSFRHEQCGGLYTNPVVGSDCPDPGVVWDGTQYVMACTGGRYAMRTSSDLVTWTRAGEIFAPGASPSWASGDFWAPEIHRVGDRWIAYFSARASSDGSLALGAATGPSALGPFTDLGRPLLHDPSPGVIDVHPFAAPDGRRFLLWKIDGNAIGRRTPIYIQELDADGISLRGARTEILTNDQPWEGPLVEAPWMIHEGGRYYLFYSANGYASTRYAVGVARSSSPLGPFEKAGAPILVSNASFAGPGHGSIVRGPRGDWVHVYHAWVAGSVGEAPGRLVLVDRITWRDGWPRMDSSPSPRSQPAP